MKILIAALAFLALSASTVRAEEPRYPALDAWREGRPVVVCASGDAAYYAVAEWTLAMLPHTPGFVFGSYGCDVEIVETQDLSWCGGEPGVHACTDLRYAIGVNKAMLMHEIGHMLGLDHPATWPACNGDYAFFGTMSFGSGPSSYSYWPTNGTVMDGFNCVGQDRIWPSDIENVLAALHS